jgi:AraC-like DNA-binding protein
MSGIIRAPPTWPHRQLVTTRDAEETRSFLRTQDFCLEMSAREARYTDTVVKGVSLPGPYLGYLQYGAAAEIRADPARDEHRILPPLRGSLEEPIVLADIVAASGIAGRTRTQHFCRFRATTPMRYLRRARLHGVCAALQRAEPEESIMSIALRCGFGHLGRFSAECRKAYGELPLPTLGRRR